jgi:hypothetical protein
VKKRLVLLTVALLLVGGIAYASIPDANGVIHGCRKNSGGALRVIDTDAGQTCAGNETALSWNQTGPQGPPGPAGGFAGWQEVVHTPSVPVEGGGTRVLCPTGKRPLGGGGGIVDPAGVQFELLGSWPFIDDLTGQYGWQIRWNMSPSSAGERLVFVHAICATVDG